MSERNYDRDQRSFGTAAHAATPAPICPLEAGKVSTIPETFTPSGISLVERITGTRLAGDGTSTPAGLPAATHCHVSVIEGGSKK